MTSGPEIELQDGLLLADGHAVVLSVHEYALLCALSDRAGHVVRREELYRLAWGAAMRPGDRTVDVYVRKLRVKLADALPEWEVIHTHVGFGYRLDPVRSRAFHNAATAR
jgi:DNA-binding response OmpR family regulator